MPIDGNAKEGDLYLSTNYQGIGANIAKALFMKEMRWAGLKDSQDVQAPNEWMK
jgi:hypothetical protein